MTGTVLALLLIAVICVHCEEVRKCPYGDSQCFKEVATSIFRFNTQGLPAIGLRKIDPVEIDNVKLKQNPSSPVNIDLRFTNLKVYGLTGAEVLNVKGFGKEILGTHIINFKTKKVDIVGDYTIDGKVLILPIKGSGFSNLTGISPTVTLAIKGEPEEKSGKTHLKIKDFKLKLNIKDLIIRLDNLFNDKALSDNMNLFLNENSKDIYHEIKPALVEQLEIYVRAIISGVFEKVPYADLFSD